MKFIRLLSVLIFFLILTTSQLYAVRAYPYPVKVKQPDGSEITIKLNGDEFFHYKSTLDGHPLISDTKGFLTYASQDENGIFHSTGFRASEIIKRSTKEKQFIQTLKPVMNMRKAILAKQQIKSSMAKISSVSEPRKAYPLSGTPKSLVILVNFTDTAFVTSSPKTAFTNMLNQSGYPTNGGTGSARDYFNSNSMGVFSPQFDVVGPVTLPHPMNYYGKNDASGDDTNPVQMVVDACTAANAAGVDFTQYDTDNDGVIDNIFIYYAGYNEAEHGPANSIWPHRWAVYPTSMFSGGNYTGTVGSITFDSKRLMDYACSSELKGSYGANMCGVGTFCHEFSHVLGLDDLYATDGGTQQTPSSWDVMDYGPYLNGGRTPCGYSSFERFYLGWLIPTELNNDQNVSIHNLSISNEAYLISQYGNHNLSGSNPNPVEFFMLENRQKTGWDTYLPSSGMLITHIYYNTSAWADNSPNNDPDAMGVDIVEADGIATENTLAGDTYPGTSNVTNWTPQLRNGTYISKLLTGIQSSNGVISFDFTGVHIQTSGNINTFKTKIGTPTDYQTFKITSTEIGEQVMLTFSKDIHFQMRESGTSQWTDTILINPVNYSINEDIEVRFNPQYPSYNTKHFDEICIKKSNAIVSKINLYGICSPVIIPPVANEAKDISYTSINANWQSVTDATGYYVSIYSVKDGQSCLSEGFNNGLTAPFDWEISATQTTTTRDYYGISSPSILFATNDEYIKTEKYILPVTSLSFYVKPAAESIGNLLIEAQNENNEWSVIDNIYLTFNSNTPIKNYNFDESKNYRRFRFTIKNINGNIAFDDIKVGFNKLLSYELKDFWENGTSIIVENLTPGTEYQYFVKASDKSDYYENITEPSNLITIKTLNSISIFKSEKDSQIVYKTKEGAIIFKTPNTNEKVSIYNVLGETVIAPFIPKSDVIIISSLPKNNIYIVKIGQNSLKIRL